MKLSKIGIERTLRISGILLILGLAVEVVSLVWEKPLAFLLFIGVGCLLTLVGILVYLYSLVPSNSLPRKDA
jgi:hypothetical protein